MLGHGFILADTVMLSADGRFPLSPPELSLTHEEVHNGVTVRQEQGAEEKVCYDEAAECNNPAVSILVGMVGSSKEDAGHQKPTKSEHGTGPQ